MFAVTATLPRRKMGFAALILVCRAEAEPLFYYFCSERLPK